MSEKRPFDVAIRVLGRVAGINVLQAEENECQSAIRILEYWPKWKPLIEAAGKTTNRSVLMSALSGWKSIMPKDSWFPADERDYREIRDLLESLPAKEEK
jgi:hypothetical protein